MAKREPRRQTYTDWKIQQFVEGDSDDYEALGRDIERLYRLGVADNEMAWPSEDKPRRHHIRQHSDGALVVYTIGAMVIGVLAVFSIAAFGVVGVFIVLSWIGKLSNRAAP